MHLSSASRVLVVSSGLVALSVGAGASSNSPPPASRSYDGIHMVWNELYPHSLSDDNIVNGAPGVNCYLCHVSNHEWNGYGWAMRELIQTGAAPEDAIRAIEGLDSDGDPTGSSNLEEILAGSQPGWRPGPNVVYYRDGTVRTNQLPPEGILGSLDPVCTSPASVSSRNGSGINPPCLTDLTLPIAGSTWQVEMDSTLVSQATATLVECRTLPASGPVLDIGEVLLDPTSPLVFSNLRETVHGVVVHELRIPANPELVGFHASIQGAILAGGKVVQLCNAEDFVVGCGP